MALGIVHTFFFAALFIFQATLLLAQSPASQGEPLAPRFGPASREVIENADLIGRIPEEPHQAYVLESDWYRRDPEAPLTRYRMVHVAVGRGSSKEDFVEFADQLIATAHRAGDPVGVGMGHLVRGLIFKSEVAERVGEHGVLAYEAYTTAADTWASIDAGPEELSTYLSLADLGRKLNWADERIDSYIDRAIAVGSAEQRRPLAASRELFERGDWALRGIGNVAQARRILNAALEIQERVAPVSVETAMTLHRLGWSESSESPDRALSYLNRAETIIREVRPGSIEHGWIIMSKGDAHYHRGNLEETEALYLEGFEICEPLAKTSTEAKFMLASARGVLGTVTCQMFRWEDARAHLERALKEYREIVPGSVSEASTLTDLGTCVSHREGNYVETEKRYRRALAIYEKRYSDRRGYGFVLFILGQLALLKGDLDDGENYLQRALDFYEERGMDGVHTARVLNAIGDLERQRGDLEAATTFYRRAFEQIREVNPEHWRTAQFQANLGDALFLAGDIDSAERHYQEALSICGKLAPNHARSVGALDGLGKVAHARDRLDEAEEFYRTAISIREEHFGPESPWLSASLRGLALVLASAGASNEALEIALRLEAIRVKHLRLAILGFPERTALTYAGLQEGGLDIALSLAASGSIVDREAMTAIWEAAARSRGLVLDEMSARRIHRTVSDDEESARLAEEFEAARRRLARLAIQGPQSYDLERYRRALDEASRQSSLAEKAYASSGAGLRRISPSQMLGFSDLEEVTPSATDVVSYFRYRHLDFEYGDGRDNDSSIGEGVVSYVALIFRHGESAPQCVPLGPADTIDRLTFDVRRNIRTFAGSPIRGAPRAEALYRRSAGELRNLVWDPVASSLSETDTVFLVPDGSLNLVTFEALPAHDSSYLAETGPTIFYLSTERDLAVSTPRADGRSLLALGDPAFDEPLLFAALRQEDRELQADTPDEISGNSVFRGQRSSCGEFSSLHFEALPESSAEIQHIADLWRGASKFSSLSDLSNVQPIILLRREATEEAFKSLASGKTNLHVATHGFFLGDTCLPRPLPVKGEAGEAPSYAAIESPLLMSGLALAGANHRQAAGPREEDGILTAEEVTSMDLTGMEWAVLSACDTGVGEVKAGEGVFGLRRAFQIAGARTVIMSLWPVEDEASREWMKRLYENRFVDGMTTMDSVHNASLSLLRERREAGLSTHPFFWAGFIAAGDWR
jgi:CHAT domain-containing protein/tetratricopeptide (TPR) repeat protein